MAAPHAGWHGASEEPCEFCDTRIDFFKRALHKPAAGKGRQAALPHAPDKEEVGNHSWTLLHTMAAYYPQQPSQEAQDSMRRFISQFAEVYPCRHCAEHLQAEMEEDPPQVQSRDSLSQWWCRTHNKVNEQLGKPQFDCSRVLQRWRLANSSTLAREDEPSS